MLEYILLHKRFLPTLSAEAGKPRRPIRRRAVLAVHDAEDLQLRELVPVARDALVPDEEARAGLRVLEDRVREVVPRRGGPLARTPG